MDKLAKPNWVLVMNGSLIGYVDEEEVALIKEAINRKVEMVELGDGSLVSARNLAILSPQAYDTFSRHQRGMWKCKYDTWHNRNEMCECGRMH